MASLKICSQSSKQWASLSSIVFTPTASYSTEVNINSRMSAFRRGTGGRSSFNGVVATVFGANGHLGSVVCNKLGNTGTQLVLPYRGDFYDVAPLKMCGDLGQVYFTPYNLKDENSIRKALKHSNLVINVVGREWETRNFSFEDIYVKGPRTIARIAKECGVERMIHVSALNATEKPEPLMLKEGSKFLSAKWRGELAVREEFPEAVIFRPSDIYGSEDRFVTYYAAFWRRQGAGMPLWKKGEHTIKQPVCVGDVAQGILNAARNIDTNGQIYQAIGPKRYQLGELVDYFFRVMRKDKEWGYYRYDLRYAPLFWLKVNLTTKLPGWPIANLGWEKLEREHVTDCVDNSLPTLEDLGVTLTRIEDRAPWLLKMYRAHNYYDEELGEFEKPAPPPIVA
ncbi:NADH dehydrogenase [ubiquinone] 1 alpha subcomplex subunit 9, mitochondrial-like [Daphnia pulicaria]|uniref:NADH dehydrogenase [ubiquinone] 1 alpha subcomplex subunit 9, mitochondrial-like n=1 Tax=Daphnia pulicaria TaxID=35523 RepID=UPI001EEC067F|nr:NADH dehydrogenase [ubiquinone] 1 alpha subcomplex subunit 9, mitochondrial-like [Daphnia pulicaria]